MSKVAGEVIITGERLWRANGGMKPEVGTRIRVEGVAFEVVEHLFVMDQYRLRPLLDGTQAEPA